MNEVKQQYIKANAIRTVLRNKIDTKINAADLEIMDEQDIAIMIKIETDLEIKYHWLEIEDEWIKAKNNLFDWAEKTLKQYDPDKWETIAICFEPLNRITYQDELINICMKLEDYCGGN